MKALLNNIRTMKRLDLLSLRDSVSVSNGDQESKDTVLKAIDEKLRPKKANPALVEMSEIRLGDIEWNPLMW